MNECIGPAETRAAMQSPTRSNSKANPVTAGTTVQPLDPETEARPAPGGPDAGVEEESDTAAPAPIETAAKPQEDRTGGQTADAPSTAVVENEPAAETPAKPAGDTDRPLEPSASAVPTPETKANPARKRQRAKNPDGRKYVPSKKAMVDPLKMDMSKQIIMPLTSSQVSLQCLECHIIFSDYKAKVRHMKLSHPAEYEERILRNALFTCYTCDSQFTNSTDLMVHQKSHTEKKPFKCLVCSQSFYKTSQLTFHQKIHFAENGYTCTDCGKLCKTMTLLKYHRRTHTGERPYVCKECGNRYITTKALQRHLLLHLPEGAEGNLVGDKAKKTQLTKDDGATTQKYHCCFCTVAFKTLRTRLHHMKTIHNLLPAAARKALSAGLQLKQGIPIITPISIHQPALLQVGPNGPLQKVDANIDKEQICRLIEAYGNVQKVNQVVILGQVPPNAPPLDLQQISQLPETTHLNPCPAQIDSMGLKETEPKVVELDILNNPIDSMEQTIILEPITPDGQLENPSFAELGSHMAAGENVELTLVQTGHTYIRSEDEVTHQIIQQSNIVEIQSDPMEQIICQNEQDLEQTIILELVPTSDLEQCQTVPYDDVPPPCLVPTTELEKAPDHTALDEQISLPTPLLLNTVELELAPLGTEQQALPSCPLYPPDTLTQTTSEVDTDLKEQTDSQIKTASLDQGQLVVDGDAPREPEERPAPSEQDSSVKSLVDGKENPEQAANTSEVEDPAAKDEVPSNLKTKQVSELPVNVMSAQELVKVRKRKPTRAFIFQGYRQELVGSLSLDDFQINASPSKRRNTPKSRPFVKFGPQSKEKKNKQQKPSQPSRQTQEQGKRGKTQTRNLSEKKETSPKKSGKGKTGHLESPSEIKSPSSTHNTQLQQIKGDKIKNKIKNQKVAKEGVVLISEKKDVGLPVFKKKKTSKRINKDQPKKAKNGKLKKNLAEPEKVKTNASIAASEIPSPQIKEDALLLLKGHKQPQLKVYKLDPLKASGQTQASPHDPQTIPQESQANKLKNSASDPTNNLIAGGKNKAGGPQKKALSLLPALQVSHQTPETQPGKPQKTRKRKASSNVETEGVITSSSKRALECNECGQRFGDVSSLQKHKTVHVVESPGLTYTNGNVFEGVSGLNLYQLPKRPGRVSGAMNAALDWDTEPELAEMASEGREQSVSFPALVPSPSLPVSPTDVDAAAYINKADGKSGADYPSNTFPLIKSDQRETGETRLTFPREPPFSTSNQTKTLDTAEPSAPDADKSQEGPATSPVSESKDQLTTEEDVKEDLLLEVDLVTVGEQNELDEPTSHEDLVPQNKSSGASMHENTDARPEQDSSETAGKSLTLQTVSCSTHHVDIKEEEEELLVHDKEEAGTGTFSINATSRRGTGRLKRGGTSKRSSVGGIIRGSESVNEQDECQLIYEECPISSDSEMNDEGKTATSSPRPEIRLKANINTAPTESVPEEKVGLELESTTTGVTGVIHLRGLQGREDNNASDTSPDIILEKILTSAGKELCLMSDGNNHRPGLARTATHESRGTPEEIKVEESVPGAALVGLTGQNGRSASVQPPHHRDVRTVLVKEESRLVPHEAQDAQGSRRIRWNVEPVDIENSLSPLMESGGAAAAASDNGCISPESTADQCIFYPVKEEEERDALRGTVEGATENLTCAASIDAPQTEHQETHSPLSVADTEEQHPPDISDFLLQSSDEEDAAGFELSDPPLDSEAGVMAYFHKTQTNAAQQPDERSQNLPTSTSLFQAPGEDNETREPIQYFSSYFGWDTWVEMANCTNKLSNMTKPVTAKEVAQFVGIHIAMGTLKFPSPRLYWEDLTKVPLIAEAVPLARFLELSRRLKLACPAKDPVNGNVQEERHDSNFQNALQDQAVSGDISQHRDERTSREAPNDSSGPTAQPDPLWKAQPLLSRFKAGCQTLRREGDYAVDRYPLPLPGKMQNKKRSLNCTTFIGFGGFLLHVDLELGLSGKEDAVEKMVPKGSMVFLCKQELSTPAMLERLLAAGVHGAGRVGGTRGQIGDEFVSSDGKLMLRRSHCGFILSTAGNAQKDTASLSENFEKAQMSAHLNRELQNLYSIPLTASAPSCWPQAVLWYLTDLALVNSWLVYRQDHRARSAPLTFMSFRLEVSKALILCSSCDTQDSVPPQPPKDRAHATTEPPNPSLAQESPLPDAATRYDGSDHWPEQLGEVEGGRCRFGDCQRTSRVMCLKCCVFLCISRNHNCFLNFHNQGSLEKV